MEESEVVATAVMEKLDRATARSKRSENGHPHDAAELEQLAHAVSHDLSQPITTIAGFADLLVRRYGDRLDADGNEFVEFISGAAGRMRTMVEDVSTYIRAGLEPPPGDEVDLSGVIETVLDSLDGEIGASGALVSVQPLPSVRGDAAYIARLFRHLISNAIKFTGGEKPRVRVSARSERPGLVRFSVSDNGIGIEAASRERVFELFQRLHAAREYPGNGAGLAIARRIVERHGGRIWIEPVPSGGTTFHFTIPPAE
jgi:light-regulated signal transduction histidine kinase (bacteriophytochrome)